MEFISNLIKRPISLVLNDTAAAAAEQQQTGSSSKSIKSETPSSPLSTTIVSTSLATLNNFDLIAEQQQLLLQQQQQRKNCAVAVNNNNNNNHNKQIAINDKNLNCNNNNNNVINCKESLQNKATNNSAVVVVDIGAGGEPLSYNSSNSKSSSSNNTATTIEELLVQINENLNQAEFAQYDDDDLTSDLLSATLTAHSPTTNKLPQTPQRSQVQTPTTPTTIFLASLPKHTAAGSAVSESTSKNNNKLQTDEKLESDPLDKNHLSNHNTGVNKINKFIGLTEFDESKIPELPGSLNPNIEEQLKLTFEENLIPTLTASSIAVLAAASKKDGTPKYLQMPNNNESETAVSSDNEIFTECQTFPGLANSANSASAHDISDMGSDHISENETFRSALNYNNNAQAEEPSDGQLNDTMENVTDFADEENGMESNQAWHDLVTSISEDDVLFSAQNLSTHELALHFDGNESMDVDMDVTSEYMQYTKNATLTADEVNSSEIEIAQKEPVNEEIAAKKDAENISLPTANCDDEIKLPLAEIKGPVNDVTKIEIAANQGTQNISLPTAKCDDEIKLPLAEIKGPANDVTKIEIAAKQDAENTSLSPAKCDDEIKLTSMEIKGPVNDVTKIEIAAKQDAKCDDEIKLLSAETNNVPINEETKPNKCNSAEDTLTAAHEDNLRQKIIPTTSPLTLNSSTEAGAHGNNATTPLISTSCNKDLKMNLNLDNSPSRTLRTVAEKRSPQFPLNEKPDKLHFPRSPEDDKPIVFLEKSEYSEKLETTSKNPLKIGLPPVIISPQLNETINMSEALSPDTQMKPNNANVSPDVTSPLVLFKSPINQNNCTFDTNLLATPKYPNVFSPNLNETINISEGISPSTAVPTSNKLNCTFGANTPSPQFNKTIHTVDTNNRRSQLPAIDTSPLNQVDGNINMMGQERDNVIELNALTLPCNAGVSPSTTISNKLNCTFGANTPSPQFNKTINTVDTNNRRIQLPVIDTSPSNQADDNFTPSAIMEQQIDYASGSNALNLKQNAIPNKRYTYTMSEVGIQENLNESSEAMDVDEEMQETFVQQSLLPTEKNENPQIQLSAPDSFEHPTSPTFTTDKLSAKEKTSCNAKDEKDIFVENFSSPVLEDLFKSPSILGVPTVTSIVGIPFQQQQSFTIHENFENNHELFLNPSDFDYLYTKGNNNVQADVCNRNSLLLKFDPLLGKPSPIYQAEKKELLIQKNLVKNISYVNSAIEENEEEQDKNHTASAGYQTTTDRKHLKKTAESAKSKETSSIDIEQGLELLQAQPELIDNARMSVDVIKDIQIENDCNKSIENSNTQLDEKQSKFNMDELEKKIKNEVLKTEDIEKKLKEAEQREEALIKRITEKDKSVTKMNVIEAYEKAIAELISEKEQLIQSYEKQLAEVKIDRDSNYHHLTSLETTFSDLHVKYEKSKEMTTQLKTNEESLLAEKKQNLENLRLQEQRYEKMKNHAMQQLETANRKLETIAKENSIETTKLKALLKKEEISRASINEQLQQKTRENAELVKICDELINGQGS